MKTIEMISVPVSDQQKAKEFYLKMGLELVIEAPWGNGQTWIQLKFPEGGANITLVNWFPNMPAGCLQAVLIHSDDIEKDMQELQSRGIVCGDVDDTPWGKFVSIKDPDGNTWSLHQNG